MFSCCDGTADNTRPRAAYELLPFPLFGVGTIDHFIGVSSRLEDSNGSVLSRSVESVYTERRNENNNTPLSVIGYLLVRHVVVGVNVRARARQGVLKKDIMKKQVSLKVSLQKQSISTLAKNLDAFVGLGEGGRKKLWMIVDENENDYR